MVLNLDNSINRRTVEFCYRTTQTLINPIINWSENDVWDFLRYYGCKSNPLYECGQKRIGCIGCPLSDSKGMKKDFKLYPKYKEAYIRAFEKMLIERTNSGKINADTWKSGEDVFYWWINVDSNQLLFDGFDILDV